MPKGCVYFASWRCVYFALRCYFASWHKIRYMVLYGRIRTGLDWWFSKILRIRTGSDSTFGDQDWTQTEKFHSLLISALQWWTWFVSGFWSNRIRQFRTGPDWTAFRKKIFRIRNGYSNCVDHSSHMPNQSLSDINGIGSNIWTVLPD